MSIQPTTGINTSSPSINSNKTTVPNFKDKLTTSSSSFAQRIFSAMRDPGSMLSFRTTYTPADSERLNQLGMAYKFGEHGRIQSDAIAVKCFKIAAGFGHANAQRNLGRMYEDGRGGLQKSAKQALKYFQLSADQNDPIGLHTLAYRYEMGSLKLPRSSEKAHELYSAALAAGDISAHIGLGVLYREGKDGHEQNDGKAVEHFMKALPNDDDGDAAYYLGLMFRDGRGGLIQSQEMAEMLLNIALVKGQN